MNGRYMTWLPVVSSPPFYPDCEISTTTVLGKVGKVDFKVTGKQILKPGWRVVFGAEQKDPDAEPTEEEGVLPDFTKGETGPHKTIIKGDLDDSAQALYRGNVAPCNGNGR